jgi:Tfp pilus assembly PilM family ATPase
MISLPDILLPKKRYFGLSIERTAIHAIELDQKGNPVNALSVTMPPDTFIEGQLNKKEEFVNAIKSLITNGHFSTPYIAVCFPEVFAYTRGCTIPIIPLDEVQEAIAWRTKELFPFPSEDIYFDWKILKKTDKEYQTIVVAVQRKLLDQLVQSLVEMGLKPLRFEPDASALVRLVKINPEQYALLVEVNPKGAYVTLVDGEKAVFTTVINYAPEDTPNSYLSNIDQTLLDIASFYKNKGMLPDDKTQVIVTGEMASPEWVTHLHELLKYPAGLLKSPVREQIYNKPYAAALQKISPPIDEQSINLLPTITQQYYDSERNMQFYKTILIRFCIIVIIFNIVSIGAYIAVTVKRQLADNQVKEIRRISQSQQGDTQALLLLNAQAKNIVSLAPQKSTPKESIEELAKLTNDKISLSQWEYDDGRLSFKITGTAQTRVALLDFKAALDKSDRFINVTLPLESLAIPVNVPFVITYVLKK